MNFDTPHLRHSVNHTIEHLEALILVMQAKPEAVAQRLDSSIDKVTELAALLNLIKSRL